MRRRDILRAFPAAVLAAAVPSRAKAEEWPSRILEPYVEGYWYSSDLLGERARQEIKGEWPKPKDGVIVDGPR